MCLAHSEKVKAELQLRVYILKILAQMHIMFQDPNEGKGLLTQLLSLC